MQPAQKPEDHLGEMDRLSALATIATALGFEIVDVAGFLDDVDRLSADQLRVLGTVQGQADRVRAANGTVQDAVVSVVDKTSQTLDAVEGSVEYARRAGKRSQSVATWVASLTEQMESVADTLRAVENNNAEIARIASQVNILAINAKIEAARAGDAGRGFAVVADAINELSRQTSLAAQSTTKNVSQLAGWIGTLHDESTDVSREALTVIEESQETDTALVKIAQSARETHGEAQRITEEAENVHDATSAFAPAFEDIGESVTRTTSDIHEARLRVNRLIDKGEAILQSSIALGGSTTDAPFIERVISDANRAGAVFAQAVKAGRIEAGALFSSDYRPIEGSNPEQFIAPFNDLLDRVMPEIQEAMLDFDERVVFCAAVNHDGYLSTHNRKFSQRPGPDPDWNQAHCRNRRLFNDRVGLKAGRNIEPFLLQVYRRDMGGGEYVMMKDLSAPIFVEGRHWGGLRVGYKF